MGSPADVTVAGLFSYPVKALAACAHERVEVRPTGLAHDREWMVVDARRDPAAFVSQRERPELATLRAEVTAEGGLRLATSTGASLAVAAHVPGRHRRIRVRVWRDELEAVDEGDDPAAWLAANVPGEKDGLRLVRFAPDAARWCNPQWVAPQAHATHFADGYPVLVTNVASLAALNAALYGGRGGALPMDRFRPNLVLDGLPAWDEDHIERLAIGEVVLRLVKPCVRCEVTTTNQATGRRLGEEPLVTLSRLRNDPDLGGVTFGWNAVVERSGRLALGQPVGVDYRF
jgi:uncharacterized protein YcbX